ncbi:MAG: carboxypeptidase-like regulatory domain-containing protein [Bacteroidetes bacterium]|nr:carboxypeptidase-like regulatory domain-containing protein [Bacteroidota bacterium]
MYALLKTLNNICVNCYNLRYLRAIVFVLLLILLHSKAHGQITITGTITNQTKTPLQGINVMVNNKNQNNILAYTLTDKNGHYQITCEINADSLQIILIGFNYGKTIRIIPAESQILNFELKEESISLKEVAVNAPLIVQTNDTLSYLVSKFATENDKTIEDVLKKMPGIEVSEGGQISYQGKPINKFYIENMDLLKGRYTLATKNISLKDVATVEVFQNHQPIRALSEAEPSDQAAINLKLREDAKGVFSLIATVGAGVAPFKPAAFLWDNELISLFFSKKMQNINTYKGNNSGNDVTQEFTSFYSDIEYPTYEGRFLSIIAPNAPPISKQRYMFNNTHAASSSFLNVLKKEYQLTTNLVYYNDKQSKESYTKSTYYLSGDTCLTVEELTNSKGMENHAAATFTLEANKENFYLKNALNLNGSWIDDKGMTATGDSIHQHLKTSRYNISNMFELVKEMSGKFIKFYSYNGFAQTPQILLIKPALYADIVNNGEPFEALRQQTIFNDISSKTHFTFGITKPKFIQHYLGGFDATVQSLNSLLQPLNNGISTHSSPDSLHNDLLWQQYKIFINLYYTYKPCKKLKLDLILPLSYNLLLINNKNLEKQKPIHRVLFTPTFTILYEITQKWSLKANYNYYSYLGSVQDTYTGYIMRNYRFFNRNDGQLADNKSHACFLRTSYRNVQKAVFSYLDLIYEYTISNMLIDYSYMGILQIQNNIRKSVSSNTYGVRGNISKNVYSWRTTFSVTGYYYDIFSSQLVQNELVAYRYSYYGLQPKIESQLSSWAGLSYAFFWNGSKTFIKKEKSDNTSIQSLCNYVKLYFYPVKRLEFMIAYEHYYNNFIAKRKNKHFVDFGISYRWKWADFSLIWTNIINTHQYITASSSGLDEFVNIYEIRPSQIMLKVKFKIL